MLFGGLDNFRLTVMAYDRFVAICHPLHDMVIRNPKLCGILLLSSWLLSVLESSLQGLMILWLSFCTEIEIPHFFCDLNQMVQLACCDTFRNDVVMNFATGLLGLISLTGILFSYYRIITSVLRILSSGGKYKASSYCRSHISVVFLVYGYEPWSVSWFYCYPKFKGKCHSLSDIHCGHTYAEPFYPQS